MEESLRMARKNSQKKNNFFEKEKKEIPSGVGRSIFILFLFTFAFVSFLSLFSLAGALGEYLLKFFTFLFGWGKFIFPFLLFFLAYLLLRNGKYSLKILNYIGIVLFLLSFLALVDMFPVSGGIFGKEVSELFFRAMGNIAAFFVLLFICIASLLLLFEMALEDFHQFFQKSFFTAKNFFGYGVRHEEEDDFFEEEEENKDEEDSVEEDVPKEEPVSPAFEAKEIRAGLKKKENLPILQGSLPGVNVEKRQPYADIPLTLLEKSSSKPISGNVREYQNKIHETLERFGVMVEPGEVHVGPTVTQFEFRPLEAIKLTKITTLHNELALALAVHPIRMEAPIPGKSFVGIEVPNRNVATVSLREILESEEFRVRKGNLCVPLGKDVSGKVWVGNLETMPHCLIAGATGSGKTVCINAMIMSLLFQYSPYELKFIMVDPKRVELPQYNGIPHLLTPVIVDVDATVNALRWAIHEMERRFELLSHLGKRNIQTYNKATDEPLPFIVVLIDELADLMSISAREVEGAIIRLAQMARAVGIHLVVATQRPSVDVLTGLIKANIPARLAFSVTSIVDSRTILDSAGAEKLLGRGDLLYISAELSRPKRLQGAFVSDDEITRVVNFLKTQGVPNYQDEIIARQSSGSSASFNDTREDDPLLDEAKRVVLEAGKASASLLQRRMRVGYARAARLLDLLEAQGFIGPQDGAKPRDVFADIFDEDASNSSVAQQEKNVVENHNEEFNEEEYLTSQEGEYLEEEK